MGNWHEFGGWGMGAGPFMMVLFWALVIIGVVVLVRSLSGSSRSGHDGHAMRAEKSPQDIVKERYARGEIDRNEYEQKMQDLGR